MTALVFRLREPPAQRLDLSPLVPNRLAGLSARDIERIEVQTTRERVCVGDVFRVLMGDAARLRFEGGHERLDRVGCAMNDGEIYIEGDVGCQAGRLMGGGKLVIAGDAGPWAASGMKKGLVEIIGNTGDRLGGPLAGETAGMRGGVVVVRKNAGERAGDRLRRGTIIVEGNTGAYAGSRMIAGTLVVRGRAGRLPGYLMNRGTIVLAKNSDALSPTFSDCGVHELLSNTLMAEFIKPYSPELAGLLRNRWRRFMGDMATIGKGEIYCPAT
ncbi:MAG TPA: formylmethanofuran dehydrogenase subunit C [Pseudolabrys sp.]|nr:formylmethanofuran dehydrogenase subunit C [Pseudolabrys sp.]